MKTFNYWLFTIYYGQHGTVCRLFSESPVTVIRVVCMYDLKHYG